MNKIQDKIISIAEKQGWTASAIEKDGADTTFNFAKFTPAGQDFSFTADMSDNDPDVLIENIFDYYQNYDPDYEASLWIGKDGHGHNGAPFHIIDIVADMKAAEDMVYQLHNALCAAFGNNHIE